MKFCAAAWDRLLTAQPTSFLANAIRRKGNETQWQKQQ
jgi:hypothetical protein